MENYYTKGVEIMCYKAEMQKKNEEKLQKKFDQDNVPMFIQEAVILRIASRDARLNTWATVRNMLLWMIKQGYIKQNSISKIEEEDLNKIIPMQMMKYMEHLLNEEGIARTTFVTKKNILSSFWGKLQERHHVRDNIVALVDSSEFRQVKTNRQKTEKLPLEEEISEMTRNIESQPDAFLRIRNKCILRILYGTGLRISELVGLDMEDVVLDESKLNERNPRPYILVISKGNYDYTDNGKDRVFLTKDATDAFHILFELRCKMENVDNKAVFVTKSGNRINVQTVKDMFRYYSNGKLSPHMMRHGYTTRLRRESNDPVFVQEQGRWKSQAMMNERYDSGTARSISYLDNM